MLTKIEWKQLESIIRLLDDNDRTVPYEFIDILKLYVEEEGESLPKEEKLTLDDIRCIPPDVYNRIIKEINENELLHYDSKWKISVAMRKYKNDKMQDMQDGDGNLLVKIIPDKVLDYMRADSKLLNLSSNDLERLMLMISYYKEPDKTFIAKPIYAWPMTTPQHHPDYLLRDNAEYPQKESEK